MAADIDDPRVPRALARMRQDGILLAPEEILECVTHPRWEGIRALHDWRRHVPATLRDSWGSLPLLTRLCVYETAELVTLEEDADAAMVTGPQG